MLSIIRKLSSCLAGYANDRRAAISPMMVFLLIPLCGIMALAGEVSFWFVTQRALQNAADSAAVAAAMSDDDTADDNGLPRYENEALAVANRYGFASTVNFVTITTTREEPCESPADEPVCYRVVAERSIPLYLTQMVGYQGDTDLGDRFGKIVRASSVARPSGSKAFCLLSLGTATGDGITFNGANGVELAGCDFGANTTVTCNGNATPAESAWYAGSAVTSSCAPGEDHPDQDLFEDPFEYLNNSPTPVPIENCPSGYDHSNNANQAKGKQDQLINSSWSGVKMVCGDAWLITSTGAAANVTLSGTTNDGSEDRTLVIFNGNLHVVGSLTTSGTAGLTIIFAKGGADPNARPGFQDNGRLDFAAPNSGTLSGAAIIVHDQYTSSGTSESLGIYGNDTFNITGLIYAKNYPVIINGTVDKAASGQNCLSIVSKSITISGTPDVFDNPTEDCNDAGLSNLPTLASGSRATLVQ